MSGEDAPPLDLNQMRGVPGAMSDDFKLGHVFTVALIIGGVVLVLGLIGILIT